MGARSAGSLLLLTLLAANASAQLPGTAAHWADSARKAIDAAYLSGNTEGLIAARALVERALTRFPDDAWLHHYRGFALYREATLRRGTGEKELARYFSEAQDALEKAAARQPIPETYALLSSVIGQQINGPLEAMTLGSKSGELMERALQLGPDNPRVWLLKGIGALHTPAAFGGGSSRAEEALRRAIELFDRDAPRLPAPAWGKGEAWLWLGQVLEAEKRWDEARQAYEKALSFEPGNNWLKFVLLPNLDKRKAGK